MKAKTDEVSADQLFSMLLGEAFPQEMETKTEEEPSYWRVYYPVYVECRVLATSEDEAIDRATELSDYVFQGKPTEDDIKLQACEHGWEVRVTS
jgi:hypothetical protein